MENPLNHFCLEGQGKYSKECDFPRDCKSNQCVKIFNDKNQFITKRCLRAKDLLKRKFINKSVWRKSTFKIWCK